MPITRRALRLSPEWMLLASGTAAEVWERVGTVTVSVDEAGRKSTARTDGTRYLFNRESRRLFTLNEAATRFGFDGALEEFDAEALAELTPTRRAELEAIRDAANPRRHVKGQERTQI